MKKFLTDKFNIFLIVLTLIGLSQVIYHWSDLGGYAIPSLIGICLPLTVTIFERNN
jgi:hypothetical protein